MTLKVTIEIVRRGDPLDRDTTNTVEISQVDDQDRSGGSRDYEYRVLEHNHMLKKGEAGQIMVVGTGKVLGHRRSLGALELLRRVLEEHVLFGPKG